MRDIHLDCQRLADMVKMADEETIPAIVLLFDRDDDGHMCSLFANEHAGELPGIIENFLDKYFCQEVGE